MKIDWAVRIIMFLLSLAGILQVVIPVYSTAILINLICVTFCFLIFLYKYKVSDMPFLLKREYIYYYWMYSFLIFIYSCFVAESYEQWRYIFTVFVPSLILPFFIFFGSSFFVTKEVLKSLLYFSFPFSVVFYLSNVKGTNDFTHYVSFIYIFLLLIPYLSIKIKLFLFFTALLSVFYDIDSRGNVLNIVFAFSLVALFYLFPKKYLEKILAAVRWFFIILPVFLFILAVSDIMNIYALGEKYKNDFVLEYNNNVSSFTKDSRSNVYYDALKEIDKNNAYVFGISAAGRHKTTLASIEDYYDNLKLGRLGSEVGILEYYLRGGFLYICVVFLLYYYSSKIAINKSKNIFCKLLAVSIAFRWFYLFIEAQPTLNLSNAIYFFAMGICLNPNFLKLSNEEIKNYLRKS